MFPHPPLTSGAPDAASARKDADVQNASRCRQIGDEGSPAIRIAFEVFLSLDPWPSAALPPHRVITTFLLSYEYPYTAHVYPPYPPPSKHAAPGNEIEWECDEIQGVSL